MQTFSDINMALTLHWQKINNLSANSNCSLLKDINNWMKSLQKSKYLPLKCKPLPTQWLKSLFSFWMIVSPVHFLLLAFLIQCQVSQKWNQLQAHPATTEFTPQCAETRICGSSHSHRKHWKEKRSHNERSGPIPALSTVQVIFTVTIAFTVVTLGSKYEQVTESF